MRGEAATAVVLYRASECLSLSWPDRISTSNGVVNDRFSEVSADRSFIFLQMDGASQVLGDRGATLGRGQLPQFALIGMPAVISKYQQEMGVKWDIFAPDGSPGTFPRRYH